MQQAHYRVCPTGGGKQTLIIQKARAWLWPGIGSSRQTFAVRNDESDPRTGLSLQGVAGANVGPGVGERPFGEVGGEHLDVEPLSDLLRFLHQDHGERIGLLTAGASGYPSP